MSIHGGPRYFDFSLFYFKRGTQQPLPEGDASSIGGLWQRVQTLAQYSMASLSSTLYKKNTQLAGFEKDIEIKTIRLLDVYLNSLEDPSSSIMDECIRSGFSPLSISLLWNIKISSMNPAEALHKFIEIEDPATSSFYQESLAYFIKLAAGQINNLINGEAALHLAAKCRPEAMEALLAAGADVDTRDHSGRTPLLIVARYHPAAIKTLLNAGAKVNVQDRIFGQTALHIVAQYYHPGAIETLIAAGAVVHVRDGCHRTPLHRAIARKQPEAVKTLLAAGAPVKTSKKNVATPLELAIQCCPEVVGLLLAKGANPNVLNEEKDMPLHLALRQENPEVVRDLVRLLLEWGANPHICDRFGETPLHLASKVCRKVSPEAVGLLLTKGANPNLFNDRLYTPLHFGLRKNNPDLVKILLDGGANPNIPDSWTKETPLELAFEYCPDAIGPLLGKGASVTARNSGGQTPLYDAIKNHSGAIGLLLDNGAQVNTYDSLGRTPLHFAYYYYNRETIRLLIQAGANTEAPDNAGLKPIDFTPPERMKSKKRAF